MTTWEGAAKRAVKYVVKRKTQGKKIETAKVIEPFQNAAIDVVFKALKGKRKGR